MAWQPILLVSLVGVVHSGVALPPDEVALLQAQARLESSDADQAHGAGGARHYPCCPGPFPHCLSNHGDGTYTMLINIGEQWVPSLLDLSSSDMVVFSSGCSGCGAAAVYDVHRSPTYEMGLVEAENTFDNSGKTVVGHGHEWTAFGPYDLMQQEFWELTDASFMPSVQGAQYGGVLGLAPNRMESFDRAKLFDNRIKDLTAAVLKTPKEVKATRTVTHLDRWNIRSFSICLDAKEGKDGLIIWNDTIAKQLPDRFLELPLYGTSQDGWDVNMTNFTFAHKNWSAMTMDVWCRKGCRVKLDTATSFLALPTKVLQKITDAFEKVDWNCSNIEEVLPHLAAKVGNRRISLPPSAYVARVVGDKPLHLQARMPRLKSMPLMCELALFDSADFYGPGSEIWVFGVPWFRKFYTTFDLGSRYRPRSVKVALHPVSDCNPIDWPTLQMIGHQDLPIRRVNASSIHAPDRLSTQRTFKRGHRFD